MHPLINFNSAFFLWNFILSLTILSVPYASFLYSSVTFFFLPLSLSIPYNCFLQCSLGWGIWPGCSLGKPKYNLSSVQNRSVCLLLFQIRWEHGTSPKSCSWKADTWAWFLKTSCTLGHCSWILHFRPHLPSDKVLSIHDYVSMST